MAGQRVWPFIALFLAMISVQYGSTFAKGLFPVVGAQGTVALRLCFGAVILCAISRPWRCKINPRLLPMVVGYGVALGLMSFNFYMSIRYIPLGVAVALEFSGPLCVALVSSRRALDFLWVVMAVIGLFFLLPVGSGVQKESGLGVAYALSAGVAWAAYSVLGRKTGAAHGMAVPAIGTAIGALIVGPIGFVHAGLGLFSVKLLLGAILVAIFSCAIPFVLEMIALVALPAQVYGTVTSVEPAIAAFAGLMFLHEHLTTLQDCAISAIMAASIGAAVTMPPRAGIVQ